MDPNPPRPAGPDEPEVNAPPLDDAPPPGNRAERRNQQRRKRREERPDA